MSAGDEYVIHFTFGGVFDGVIGTFATRDAADFFLFATANGGRPSRAAEILTLAEYRERIANESAPARVTSGDEPDTRERKERRTERPSRQGE